MELVRALLRFKANPDARITKGTSMRRTSQDFDLPAVLFGATPFALAAKFLEPEMARALAGAGADMRLGLPDGTTPLVLALGVGVVNNADRRGVSLLDGGAIEGEDQVLATVEAIVALGADLKAVSRGGDSALHVAALGRRRPTNARAPSRCCARSAPKSECRLSVGVGNVGDGGSVRTIDGGWWRTDEGPRSNPGSTRSI